MSVDGGCPPIPRAAKADCHFGQNGEPPHQYVLCTTWLEGTNQVGLPCIYVQMTSIYYEPLQPIILDPSPPDAPTGSSDPEGIRLDSNALMLDMINAPDPFVCFSSPINDNFCAPPNTLLPYPSLLSNREQFPFGQSRFS